MKSFFLRLKSWEYWNSNIVYFPLMPYLLRLMIKCKSVFFFRVVNPGIEFGGFTMESKWKIQEDCGHAFFPKTLLIDKSKENSLLNLPTGFSFPLILKPDIGGKGRGVFEISNEADFKQYFKACPVPFLIQEKISYPQEIGVFFVKNPDKDKGEVTGIVAKSFVSVIGDGTKTVLQLLEENPRFYLQLDKLKLIIKPEVLTKTLGKNETQILTEIGNHAQGSKFEDVSQLNSLKFTEVMNKIANTLPGFYFGRIDIRFTSWEKLERAEEFAIIEINGAGSEPTHIYDPKHSIYFAWKEIKRHWKMMAEIALQNSKNSHKGMSFREGIRLLRNHRKTMNQITLFSKNLTLNK